MLAKGVNNYRNILPEYSAPNGKNSGNDVTQWWIKGQCPHLENDIMVYVNNYGEVMLDNICNEV